MFIRAEILSGLFTNLAAGWFALILITPQIVANSYSNLFSSLFVPFFGGIICLTIAELILRFENNDFFWPLQPDR